MHPGQSKIKRFRCKSESVFLLFALQDEDDLESRMTISSTTVTVWKPPRWCGDPWPAGFRLWHRNSNCKPCLAVFTCCGVFCPVLVKSAKKEGRKPPRIRISATSWSGLFNLAASGYEVIDLESRNRVRFQNVLWRRLVFHNSVQAPRVSIKLKPFQPFFWKW